MATSYLKEENIDRDRILEYKEIRLTVMNVVIIKKFKVQSIV